MTIGRLSVCLFLVVGCSVGESMDDGNSGPWATVNEPADDDDDDDDDEDSSDGEDPGETSTSGGDDTPANDDDGDSSTGAEPGMDESSDSADPTFGDPDDDGGADGGAGGSQPASGPWSACPAEGGCGPGLTCIVSELIVASLCVETCGPAGDPSSCSPSPGGTATPSCMQVNTTSYCVLDCSGGETCPNGMICHEEDGASICL